MVRALSFVLGIAVVVSAGCASAASTPPGESTSPPPAVEDGVVKLPEASRPFLGVEAVTSSKQSATVDAPARVDFRDGAVSQLGAPLDGRVVAVHAQIGQTVTAGEPLVTLNCPDAAEMRAAVETANANLREARAAVERQARMLQQGVGIERDKIAADTKVSELEAEVTRVRADSEFVGGGSGTTLVIRAPIAGTVINRRANVGMAVQKGGDPLIEIGDASALWVVADVFERDLPLLHDGARADVRLPSLKSSLDGHVSSIGAVVASGLRTAPVRIAIESRGVALKPGMYGRALLQAANSDITVPTSAVLIKDGKETVVYVQSEPGVFRRRQVVVGEHIGDRVQIVSGLAPGDLVVVKGALLLDSAADQLL